ERLLRHDPAHARGLFLRARTRLARGEAAGAAGDLRAYVRLQPGDPHGYRELARCLTALGRDREARAQRRIAGLVQQVGGRERPVRPDGGGAGVAGGP
ncbi:MAG: hypothetical protein ACE5JG_04055, partial [Planctomycetota bacterium]